jgi:hypothetical protein
MVRHKISPRFTGTDWYQCTKARQLPKILNSEIATASEKGTHKHEGSALGRPTRPRKGRRLPNLIEVARGRHKSEVARLATKEDVEVSTVSTVGQSQRMRPAL